MVDISSISGWQYASNALVALSILIIGWIVAYVAGVLTKRMLNRTDILKRSSKTLGADDEARMNIYKWISRFVYWLILIFVIIAFFEELGFTVLTEPLNAFLTTIFQYLPRLIYAGIIVVVAWLVATLAKAVISKALTAAKFDQRFGSEAGIEGEKQPSLIKTTSEAAFWLVLLLFLPVVLSVLELGGLLAPVMAMIGKILTYLPNILGAIIVLFVGWFIARVAQRVVTNLLVAAGAERLSDRMGLARMLGPQGLSNLVGLVVYILILIPVLIASFQVLALDAITQPAITMLNTLLNSVPYIFAAAVVLVIAYVLGRIIADLIAKLLTNLGFDNILSKLGISKEPSDGKKTPSEIIGYLGLVVIMLFAFIEASQILGFTLLADLITQFTIFVGQIILGLIIIAIGIYLANLSYDIIRQSQTSSANLLALLARIAILFLALAMGLSQMGMATSIINLAFGLLLGAMAIAAAVAFGLGGRDIAHREIEKWLQTMRSKENQEK
jgi:Mechanosensitive ion channel, conserved TM helix